MEGKLDNLNVPGISGVGSYAEPAYDAALLNTEDMCASKKGVGDFLGHGLGSGTTLLELGRR